MRAPACSPSGEAALGLRSLRSADVAFAGPGSPTYALREWRESAVGDALLDRLQRPGVTIFASAAACTVGSLTLPVYEIYKAGARPHWLEGLGLLRPFGIDAVVIPHFDNAEGRNHDTRYCYMGERRLRALLEQLPSPVAVLGIDEHTALVLDLGNDVLEVQGRGGVTVRGQGVSEVLPAGLRAPIATLRDLLRTGSSPGPVDPAPAGPVEEGASHPAGPTIVDLTRSGESRFRRAEQAADYPEMAEALLDLEATLADWWATSLDPEEEIEPARSVLRSLIASLAEVGRAETKQLSSLLATVAEGLLGLRSSQRSLGRYEFADQLRQILVAAGIRVHDHGEESTWELPHR
ncbi:MAG TPA: hypothetical protein VIA06_14135 [Candidatus Dormibacteraeota bacterium]|nr:hypothetical protein [Candidatus Dormibacteraeota bacterium]